MKKQQSMWRVWYICVLAFLALQIAFYYWFTKRWS
jgi:hypothetical protein